MLDFLIDTMFVLFGGQVFQQTIGMPMDMKQTSFKSFLKIKYNY
jgi:hypothetical protein